MLGTYGFFLYICGDMAIWIQILFILALMALVMWLTASFWKRIYHKQKLAAHIKRMKDLVTSEKQANTLKSKVVFLTDVLGEVQKQHEGLSSYMKLLTTADLQPGQEEWDMVCGQLKDRAHVLGEMVNGTLTLMKYEDMTDIDRNDSVAVNLFCQDVFEGCQPYLEGEVDLRFETELDDDEVLHTNLKGLQQILTNLIRCSMQFTHVGEIVLQVKHHQQDYQKYLKFTLSDTGLGIPDDSKDIAFERMTQTDISIKNVVVRLRLCSALVKLLGGSISLDPSRKKGTSMTFTIKDGE